MIKPYYKINNCELYQCDNLELLKELSSNYIDLIYCDILYGTGRNFGDYQDLKPDQNVIIKHYAPRIERMFYTLKNTGSIYLQMDTRINHWLRNICDDIFGYKNFRREIVWCYLSGGISKTDFPQKHDVIIKYSKTDKYFYQPELKEYSEKTMQRGLTKCKGNYQLSTRGTPVVDWWNDITPLLSPTCYERLGYNTQKPKKLLQRIIESSSKQEDLIADFYMGSGTTGEVALELNRKFIGCDIGDNACKISKERLEKLIEP
jgi:DNA modification methylase